MSDHEPKLAPENEEVSEHGLDGNTAEELMAFLDGADEMTPWAQIKAASDRLEMLDPQPAMSKEEALKKIRSVRPKGLRRVAYRQSPLRRVRHTILLVALLVIVFSIVALAVFPNLYQRVVYPDTYIVSGRIELEVTETPAEKGYASLREALMEQGQGLGDISPSWIPERFSVSSVKAEEFETFTNISATYKAEDSTGFYIRVTSYTNPLSINEKFETDEGTGKQRRIGETDYFITENNGKLRAQWSYGGCICSLYGDLTEEELLLIISSINYDKDV